jgi:hypothetical protein
MTPQERDLITALLDRLQRQPPQSKDAEADALIRQRLAQLPDAPYLLVQTVLIQDMALHDAHDRIKELEGQVAAKAAPPTSFLGRGSVPAAGAAPRPQPAPTWTQSGAAAAPPSFAQPMSGPQMLAGGGSGFLRQAAATAAGIAGGALLFEGIQSLFAPHVGGGFLSGAAAQPGLSETVINNYYGDSASDRSLDTAEDDRDRGADYADNQDDLDGDTDVADLGDSGGDGSSSFDV